MSLDSLNYYIFREGKIFGPYTLEQLQIYGGLGYLCEDDWTWKRDASSWVRLGDLVSTLHRMVQPPPLKRRSFLKMTGLFIVWSTVFWLGGLFGIILLASILHPSLSEGVALYMGQTFSKPLLWISMGMSLVGTLRGKLPGTSRSLPSALIELK